MGPLTLAAILLLSLPVVQAQVPQIKGYGVLFQDDFTGKSNTSPDPNKWIIDTGTSYPGGPPNWGTWEVQTYTNNSNNVRVNGAGNLQITAIKDTATGSWTSGRIESRQADFMARRGGILRVQASLKIPSLGGYAGIGYWPAFWTLGSAYRGNYWNWPAVGEIDIMENVNNLDRTWAVLHCGTQPGGECNEPSGLGANRGCPNKPCVGNFHTYTVEIDRTKAVEAIRWYVDNVQYHQVLQSQLPAATWTQAVQKPHIVLLNLAIGGAFPDAVYGKKTPLSTTLSGGTYEAEYVAVYHTR
ncbi:endo-1,3-beta-glucanase [Colletotrichum higginsianum]|uniref:Endo-1,3-beta-glucanase n=2 Tax=Colletotrichum higginsianum TaxID=80884 RepID=H1VE17_COLHI|nr:Endo-1,3-beta-glucanase [Colletotrichum higginsianum IMI 349063]OBR09637.1 Endo-1,3-beta-glucanase [Colletotrichum higginsianum IMI 349063]TIC95430.1 Glucan endo-1,3-beta-glucosidase A1 [Colletotrichum higginsianum]CCF38470.1 endo-1,3-beta-glucanase [Colletotrichum higginsianum]